METNIKEIWKDITDFPKYSVSNFGNVKNNRNGSILKPYPNFLGYLRVNIRSSNGYKLVRIHKLVAHAFIPNPENKPIVNHIDNDVKNNNISNLEWCTHKENTQHAHTSGRLSRLGRSKRMSKEQAEEIRKINGTITKNKIAQQYGISVQQVYRIVRGTHHK